LRAAVGRLEAGSPLKLLARGYSVTTIEHTSQALSSVAGVKPGATLVTQLTDGRIWSTASRIDLAPINPLERTLTDADTP
jgi:hypothetical protein